VKNPSVLLIGGCGYIGSYLYKRLVENGIQPLVVDALKRGNPGRIPCVEQDYDSLGKEELDKFDTVIWFAGHSSVQQAQSDPHGALANNCLNLFSFAKRLKPSAKLIYASSGSLYSSADWTSCVPSRENELVAIPYQNAYDISKFAFDYLAENFLKNLFALRMGTLAGYSENLRSELLFNAMSLSAATSGKVFVKNSDAGRTILFLDDLWLLVNQLLNDSAVPGIYNAGSLSGTIGEFARAIADTFGAEVVNQGNSETYSFMLDTSRMDALVRNSRQNLSLSQRSREFINSCRQNGLAGHKFGI
jgi:UDP-glucose 4-epimerase